MIPRIPPPSMDRTRTASSMVIPLAMVSLTYIAYRRLESARRHRGLGGVGSRLPVCVRPTVAFAARRPILWWRNSESTASCWHAAYGRKQPLAAMKHFGDWNDTDEELP